MTNPPPSAANDPLSERSAVQSPLPTEQPDRYALQRTDTTAVPTIALKRDDAFLIMDTRGDLSETIQEAGIYWEGTRYLRVCELFMAGLPLQPLSHSVSDAGDQCQVDLTNALFPTHDDLTIPQGTVHVRRTWEWRDQQLSQQLTLTSYAMRPITVLLGMKVNADYHDIFEVRGMVRTQRGQADAPLIDEGRLRYGYRGLDGITRTTQLDLAPAATHLMNEGVFWQVTLVAGQPLTITITIHLAQTTASTTQPAVMLRPAPAPWQPSAEATHSDNVFFNQLLNRSQADVRMMSALTPEGYYPFAGLPWYVCPFGRDGLITSLEMLPWHPELARGTLAFLAAHQGQKVDAFTEEEPGKIMHEFRRGEMANMREIPFIPYYGTIDATPLFIMTLVEYLRWTNDLAFLRDMWPHAQAAARWMRDFGDADEDGFLEYQRPLASGLVNQGWKDSWDAISHSDGTLAEAPIALCEVQGYAYAAYLGMAYLATRLGEPQLAQAWQQQAAALRTLFQQHFWWEAEGTCYLALDGNKEPCQVVASNAGHCLWTGILSDEQAARVCERLMQPDMYSEWGIRTLATGAARYNPMSYHNGSVWPHDTAIAGAGSARYGQQACAGQLLGNLYGVSLYYERARLPELLCGFARHHGYGPTHYPVACAPQSWAAGAPFLLLAAMLGLQPEAEANRLTLVHPTLPDWLRTLDLPDLRVGQQRLHLHLRREGDTTVVDPLETHGIEVRVQRKVGG